MSHLTAITRKKPSAPAQWLVDNGYLPANNDDVLDYGCGRGTDSDTFGWFGYDPAYRNTEDELEDRLRNNHKWKNAYCGYVLNVVSHYTQTLMVGRLARLSETAYIAVRRDLPRGGKAGRGCWQRYVELDLPIVHETSGYCIYKL